MTDQPAPLTDDELARLAALVKQTNVPTSPNSRLVATVEQAHRERDDALAKGFGQRSLDLLEKYEALKSEHADCFAVVHQQEEELSAAYAVIRRWDATWEYVFGVRPEPPCDEWSPAEQDAIHRARATTETSDG